MHVVVDGTEALLTTTNCNVLLSEFHISIKIVDSTSFWAITMAALPFSFHTSRPLGESKFVEGDDDEDIVVIFWRFALGVPDRSADFWIK